MKIRDKIIIERAKYAIKSGVYIAIIYIIFILSFNVLYLSYLSSSYNNNQDLDKDIGGYYNRCSDEIGVNIDIGDKIQFIVIEDISKIDIGDIEDEFVDYLIKNNITIKGNYIVSLNHELCHRNQLEQGRLYYKSNKFGDFLNEVECYSRVNLFYWITNLFM